MFRTNWTNACEIFRDLSVAQGDVPVSVEGTLGAGDKPPALNIKEETEEEYFLCSGDGVIEDGPDLGLIQDMLDMVREENLSEDETPQETLVVITKPTIVTPPAIQEKQKIVTKKKPKRRNIALESFIGIDITPKPEVKLLKPDDLITKPKVVEPDLCAVESSINKVNDWLLSNEGAKVTKKSAVCLEPMTNMFRKKTKGKSPIESPKENLSIKTGSNPKSPNQSHLKEFIPSANAAEYCNKYKEKAKLKENMVEDIWIRAEKQMKVMDEKRKAEAVIAFASQDTDAAAATEIITTSESPDASATTDIAVTLATAEPTTDIAAVTDAVARTVTIGTSDTAATTHTTATTDIEAMTDMTVALQDPKEATTTSNEHSTRSPQDPREKLELPGHRHLLTDDCIVCQAFIEFGYTGFSENMS